MNKKNKQEVSMNVLAAHSLIELIEAHKEECDGTCTLSVFSLKSVYEGLVGRKCTKKELSIFI